MQRLFHLVSASLKSFSKSEYVKELSQAIRCAIWNFIVNSPHEFLELYKKQKAFPGAVDLFEAVAGVTKSKKDKRLSIFWPMMSMLLSLCPEQFSKSVASGKSNDSASTFLSKGLLRSINGKDKTMIHASAQCFVDLYRVTNYLPRDIKSGPELLASIIEEKLCEILVSEVGAVPMLDGSADTVAMAHFLRAIYLRDSKGVGKKQMLICLRGTIEQQLAAVKALLLLANDHIKSDNVPKHIKDNILEFAEELRTIFALTLEVYSNAAVHREQHGAEMDKQLLRRKKKSILHIPTMSNASNVVISARNFELETIDTLLHLFSSYPKIFLHMLDAKMDTSFQMIADCFVEVRNNQIHYQCARFIKILYLQHSIENWQSEDENIISSFVKISAAMLLRFSQALFEIDTLHGFHLKSLLFVIRFITFRAKQFYTHRRESLTSEVISDKKRLQSLEILASNLLVCLCTTDKSIWKLTTKCFRDICDQIDILQNQDQKYLNYQFYRQISSVDTDDGNDFNKLREAQIQYFRRIEVQTKSYQDAFHEIYRRWRDMHDDMQHMDKDIFKGYMSLLCALGGAVLQQKSGASSSNEGANKLDEFISDLIVLMISMDKSVRQMVTYTIATDLSPALYDKLFSLLYTRVSLAFSEGGEVKMSTDMSIFVEQTIYIVKTIAENNEATYDLALATKFDDLLLALVKYCSRMAVDMEGVQLRCKIGLLIESVMYKSEFISFQDESSFRSKLVKQFMEWTSDFHSRSSAPENESTKDAMKLLEEVDFVAMRAIAALLKNHAIKSEDKEEVFFDIFSFLNRYLQKNKDEKASSIREFVIKGLENLLHGNVSHGLEHFFSMVYQADERLRSVYLVLLASLIKKGLNVGDDDEDLADHEEQNEEETVDQYNGLMNLILDYDLDALFALFDNVKNFEKDDLCEAVIRIFQIKGEDQLVKLLRVSVEREVQSTIQPATLFRANSTASKLMRKYCARVARDYLDRSVGKLVRDIHNSPQHFEVDPSRCEARKENQQKNAQNVLEVLNKFLDSIFESLEYMPFVFREYCRFLWEYVGEKFKDNGEDEFELRHIAVGGFLFLRLIVPAITSPQSFNLTSGVPGSDSLRFCIIISKVLQNLANGIASGNKEEYMTLFEPFIRTNFGRMKQFFEDLSMPSKQSQLATDNTVSDEELREAQLTLHKYFFDYRENIRPSLQTFKKLEPVTKKAKDQQLQTLTNTAAKSDSLQDDGEMMEVLASEELDRIIEALGRPPEQEKQRRRPTKSSGQDAFSSVVFDQFMNRMQNKDVSAIEKLEMFYQKGETKSKQPVFYFVPHRFDNSDLALYHILKTMESHWTKPYVIVVDNTAWDDKYELQFSTFLKLARYMPKGPKKNLKEIFVFNANSAFKASTKKLVPMARSSNKIFRFFTSIEEMSVFIEREQIALTQDALNAEKDIVATFHNVQRVVTNRVKESSLRLTHDYVYIFTHNEKLLGYEATRVDAIPFSIVSDVSQRKTLLSGRRDFTIRYDEDKAIHLRAADRDHIMQTIRAGIARKSRTSEIGKASKKKKKTRALKVSDVPGQMLNVALLNLDSSFSRTRQAAYALLASCIHQFNLPLEYIVESNAVTVPANTEDLVIDISNKVAETRPNLTLEFLLEALKSYEQIPTNRVQMLITKYTRPWFFNLRNFTDSITASKNADIPDDDPQKQKDMERAHKVHEIINTLTRVTSRFRDVLPSMTEVWKSLAKDSVLLEVVASSLIEHGLSIGVKHPSFSITCDLILTLSSAPTGSTIANMLIVRLMDLIENKLDKYGKEFDSSAAAPDVLVLCRYLMVLSFQNHCNVIDNLPRILFIVTTLLGLSNVYLRSTLHALCRNALHSLVITIPASEVENRQKAAALVSRLQERQFITLFMGTTQVKEADAYERLKTNDNVTFEPLDMYKLETFAQYLEEVLRSFELYDATWRENWITILKRTIVERGDVMLFPRSFIIFSTIANPMQSRNMIEYALNYLGTQAEAGLANSDLVIAIMQGTVQLTGKLNMMTSDNVLLSQKLFLLGISMLPFSSEDCFLAIINMLQVIIGLIADNSNMIQFDSIGDMFNQTVREDDATFGTMLADLEKVLNISFAHHFSFAIALLTMKGLTSSKTKESTISLLRQMLVVSNKMQFPISHSLGYISGLIAFDRQYHSALYCEHLFQKDIFAHPNGETAYLFQKFMFALVAELTVDSEKVALYRTLMRGFEAMPSMFTSAFKDHHSMSHVVRTYTGSTSNKVIESTLALFKSMSNSGQALSTKEHFEECGFGGFKQHINFKSCPDKVRQSTQALVIQFLTSQFQDNKILTD